MDRSDIYTNSSNSNWTKETVQKTLEQEVYNDANAWKKFLQYFLITLAIGFSTAGIIFFFAFNWDKHALAITNRGGATANEIAELARYIQLQVSNKFGITLVPEPNLIGF